MKDIRSRSLSPFRSPKRQCIANSRSLCRFFVLLSLPACCLSSGMWSRFYAFHMENHLPLLSSKTSWVIATIILLLLSCYESGNLIPRLIISDFTISNDMVRYSLRVKEQPDEHSMIWHGYAVITLKSSRSVLSFNSCIIMSYHLLRLHSLLDHNHLTYAMTINNSIIMHNVRCCIYYRLSRTRLVTSLS